MMVKIFFKIKKNHEFLDSLEENLFDKNEILINNFLLVNSDTGTNFNTIRSEIESELDSLKNKINDFKNINETKNIFLVFDKLFFDLNNNYLSKLNSLKSNQIQNFMLRLELYICKSIVLDKNKKKEKNIVEKKNNKKKKF